ncbi:MAG: hypothetical protein EP346_06950 [Bacteroidetes bacterium]|nr:MAG: hypothetical protein EP346_06950 [Bacteroidota bacterium]
MSITKDDKLRLLRYKELVRGIQESTSDLAQDEDEFAKRKRINKTLNDYRKFVKYYFPEFATVECADFHVQAANKIRKEKNLDAVFEWARGHAKSTHLSMMIPLWLKALGEIKVMVLVSKNQDNAETLLSDLKAQLEGNQRYIADFGQQRTIGDWGESKFATRDDCAFFALGRGQSPRGLRHRQHRPDYIIMDDIDDDELCRNPDRVRKVVEWCKEALFFTTDMGRGRFILVGNRISNESVLDALSKGEHTFHTRVNALKANGEPSWPDKYTAEEIQRIIAKGYRSAQKELFNNPIAEGAVFKRRWIRYEHIPKFREYDAIVSYCDPSFKNSSTSDYKAIVTLGKKGAKLYIINAFVRKCSISEMVRWWYDFHESLPSTVIIQYYMEANFLQDMILDEFVKEGTQRGYQLPLRPDKRKKPDKFARIEALSPLFERGLVSFNDKKEKDSDMRQLVEQLLSLQKGSRVNDDAPDALEGAAWLLGRIARINHGNWVTGKSNRRSY